MCVEHFIGNLLYIQSCCIFRKLSLVVTSNFLGTPRQDTVAWRYYLIFVVVVQRDLARISTLMTDNRFMIAKKNVYF